jgi:chromosomal replication initiation ATPase DnaA
VKGQMSLDLGHRPALGRDDFLVGDSNREAVAWIDSWPRWGAPGLVLYGAPRSGKSHLAGVWLARANAVVIEAEGLIGDRAVASLGTVRAVVLEAADRVRDERAMLHLYNQIAERGGHVLLTAAAPPTRWGMALPDLRSRLSALPAVGLGPPDDQLFPAILIKLFADRQVLVAAEVINYLAVRLERSVAAAEQAVGALDRGAMALRRPVTIAVVREVLKLHDPA